MGIRDEVDTQGTVRGPPATPFCSCRRGRYRVLEEARGIRDEVDAQGPVRGLPATPNRCCRACGGQRSERPLSPRLHMCSPSRAYQCICMYATCYFLICFHLIVFMGFVCSHTRSFKLLLYAFNYLFVLIIS